MAGYVVAGRFMAGWEGVRGLFMNIGRGGMGMRYTAYEAYDGGT